MNEVGAGIAKCPFVVDENGRKLFYAFRPAADPENSRTVVILHGHAFVNTPSKYSDPNWNIIMPFDNYGVNSWGTWFLGENNDFFILDMIQRLVSDIQEQTKSKKGLYWMGSSMGGYGAILHGILSKADAVYAHIPQIRLLGSDYSNKGNCKYFEPIFGGRSDSIYNDLTSLLGNKPVNAYPTFFITQNRWDYANYIEQQTQYFINACQKNGLNYYFNIIPKKGHTFPWKMFERITLFDEFAEEINDWKQNTK